MKLRIFAGLCLWRLPNPDEQIIAAESVVGTVAHGINKGRVGFESIARKKSCGTQHSQRIVRKRFASIDWGAKSHQSKVGKTVETLESFDTGEAGVPHAFHQHDALMCGYCTPGFVTACKAFLDKNKGKEPTLADVKEGLNGNICRCGTYVGVFEAALAAAKSMKGA